MPQSHGLEYIGETSWDEVLRVWRSREEEVWRSHYEGRGWRTWLAWRMHYMGEFRPQMRRWSLYRVVDPSTTVPTFTVGAFRGWKQYYLAGSDVATFADIAWHPTLLENYSVSRLVMDGFPPERQIVAFRNAEKIVVRDGTHHCAAIALAAQLGRPVEAPTIVALTDFDARENDLFQRSCDQRFAPSPQRGEKG